MHLCIIKTICLVASLSLFTSTTCQSAGGAEGSFEVLSQDPDCSLCEEQCLDGVCVVDNKDQSDTFGTACFRGTRPSGGFDIKGQCGQLLVGRQECDASNMCIGVGVLDYAGILGHGTWCCSLEGYHIGLSYLHSQNIESMFEKAP